VLGGGVGKSLRVGVMTAGHIRRYATAMRLAEQEARTEGTTQPPSGRGAAKRLRIVAAAMRHFAVDGLQDTRVEDIAADVGVAKGSVFQHFGSKEGLFLAAYKRATASLPTYLDAPEDVQEAGFFAVIRYWLERTQHLVHEDWVPYRVTLIGNYCSDLRLKQEINRYLSEEDPYGTIRFIQFGIRRNDVRSDIDVDLVVSLTDWLMERFQDTLVAEELDSGLIPGTRRASLHTQTRIDQFMDVLRSAIGIRSV
jgi:TetR/AcrR family transcriptional regulator